MLRILRCGKNRCISRARSERALGIGCAAYRQKGLLRGWESFVALSMSDFAGDGNRPQRASGTDRHQRRRESSTLALVTGERELYSRKRQFDELLRFGVTHALKKQRRAKAPIPRLKLRSAHRATQGKKLYTGLQHSTGRAVANLQG